MNTKLLSLSVIGLSLATTGCKLKDKLTDALDGENDSYCETVCDWATACVDGYTTSMTQEEAYAACIEATEAEDRAAAMPKTTSPSTKPHPERVQRRPGRAELRRPHR